MVLFWWGEDSSLKKWKPMNSYCWLLQAHDQRKIWSICHVLRGKCEAGWTKSYLKSCARTIVEPEQIFKSKSKITADSAVQKRRHKIENESKLFRYIQFNRVHTKYHLFRTLFFITSSITAVNTIKKIFQLQQNWYLKWKKYSSNAKINKWNLTEKALWIPLLLWLSEAIQYQKHTKISLHLSSV